jgi:glycosyltransferase involved in cell wall biosynthesis
MKKVSLRIAILWSALASYSVAFFRQLAESEGCRLLLVHRKPSTEAPFGRFDLSFCEEALEHRSLSPAELGTRLHDFSPDCILMSGWAYPNFMQVARQMRRDGVYVVAVIDNQWRETLKQYLGIVTARWFLKPSIDTFLVAGDRQAQFARKLGYEQVLYGCYAADIDSFSTEIPVSARQRAFLFVGRLIAEKNIENLVEAYQVYRDRVSDPWELVVAGTGPLATLLNEIMGVRMLGFVQPQALSEVMREARCLVMPSVFEPWGVAIHEGAAAGLSIIASYRCGATPTFVRDGVNGFVVTPDAKSIAAAMTRIHHSGDQRLDDMAKDSRALAALWTPRRLASYFHMMVAERVAQSGAPGQRVTLATAR